jgi:hypothetical protein
MKTIFDLRAAVLTDCTACRIARIFCFVHGSSLVAGRGPHWRGQIFASPYPIINGGAFAALTEADWNLIRPYLEENERLFGIPLARLLSVDGAPRSPVEVYRKIVPAGHKALAPEEAWVRKEATGPKSVL